MLPIRWRLTLFHAFSILVVALVLIAALFLLVAQTIDRDTEESARGRAFEAASIVESGRDLTDDDLDRLGKLGAYVVARDANGTIRRQTKNVDLAKRNYSPAMWQEAIATGKVVEQGQSLSWFAQGPT